MTDPGWERRFDELAAELIAQGQIPAAAVALAREGEVVYERGFGHRDAAGTLPVTPDTRFGLGSVTKSFPTLAIMQLTDAGRLSPAEPVSRWLPEFRLPRAEDATGGAPITIHHFMTHSSGIPPEPALLHARAASILVDPDLERLHPPPLGVPTETLGRLEQVQTYEELMALMARQDWPALGPPGRVLSYSNEGYVLLAAIVERASGLSFPDYLREHVLGPIGMERTGLYTRETPPLEPEVVPFARDDRDGRREVFASPAWWDQGRMFGNGGLKSTTRDLLRYLEVYRNGGVVHGRRVLSAAGVEQMTRPQMPIATGGAYGYGLQVGQAPGGLPAVEHGGGNKGVATHVTVLAARGLTAVALTNLASAPAAGLAHGVVNAYLGLDPARPWATYPPRAADPTELPRLAGTYRGQPGAPVRVSLAGGQLRVEMADETLTARPCCDGAFVLEPAQQPARFLEDERGEVGALAVGLRVYPRAVEG